MGFVTIVTIKSVTVFSVTKNKVTNRKKYCNILSIQDSPYFVTELQLCFESNNNRVEGKSKAIVVILIVSKPGWPVVMLLGSGDNTNVAG